MPEPIKVTDRVWRVRDSFVYKIQALTVCEEYVYSGRRLSNK